MSFWLGSCQCSQTTLTRRILNRHPPFFCETLFSDILKQKRSVASKKVRGWIRVGGGLTKSLWRSNEHDGENTMDSSKT